MAKAEPSKQEGISVSLHEKRMFSDVNVFIFFQIASKQSIAFGFKIDDND